ncbi:class I SAM-dependent methyltransferase [Paraconexibacter sp.]|uniref:class I SAM-dependent methyltransferase n=1 Tax=Paraconexibacter sp. TaxID=2949640 RepID=UPI0035618465
MSFYGTVFAQIYDPFLAWGERAGLRRLRSEILAEASGAVLEIGAGTGLNVPHYGPAVTSLTLADPEQPMVKRLQGQQSHLPLEPVVALAPAEELPFEDDAFDTVVSTLVLCTVTDVDASLAEIRRVLRPDGKLLFIEHVRADSSRLAGWQDRLHEPWRRFGYGCHCNRDTHAALAAAGFQVGPVRQERWRRMPAIVAPLIAGAAVPATA